jgi:hypothetical protein
MVSGLALAALLALSACGGSSEPAVDPVTETSAEVGTGGGSLTLQGLALALPPNALPQPVNVAMASQPAGPGEIARFRLAPAGQRLAVPTELRFARAGLPAKTSFFWEVGGELRLVPSKLIGDVLTARIGSLGLTASGNLLAAGGQPSTARSRALAVKALAIPPGDDGTVVVRPIDCATQIPQLSRRLKAAAAGGDQELATTVYDELEATQQLCLESDIQALRKSSCDALEIAQFRAQTVLADKLSTFQEITLPLLSAEAFVQLTGATCAAADSANVGPLIAAKFEQFLQVLQSQQLRDGFASEATARDLRVLFSFKSTCDQLELGAICERLSNEIFPNLLDGMRRAAFDECRATGTALVVSQFHFLGTTLSDAGKFLGFGRFGLADVEADLSYCTNPSLELRVFADATGLPLELAERASTLHPLVGLGDYRSSATMVVPRDGSLTVSGQVPALRCAEGSASAADLVVRIGAREVARRAVVGNAYPLSTSPLDLVMSRVLLAVGLDPQATTSFTLTINREGGECLGALGPTLNQDLMLFEIRVDLPPQEIAKPVGTFDGVYVINGRVPNDRFCFNDLLQPRDAFGRQLFTRTTSTTNMRVDDRGGFRLNVDPDFGGGEWFGQLSFGPGTFTGQQTDPSGLVLATFSGTFTEADIQMDIVSPVGAAACTSTFAGKKR